MKFQIEKGLPLPTNLRESGVAATLRLMEIGDSVFDSGTNDVRVKSRWNSAASRQQRGVRIRKQVDDKGQVLGYRVWRVR